jgi:bifunctional non-homologous end joining protein LigD
VYSLRAKERPTASAPVRWDEVEACLNKGDPNLLVFDSDAVLERAKKHGDLFEPVLKLKQKIPPMQALLDREAGVPAEPAATPRQKVKKTAPAKGTKASRPAKKKTAGARKRG